MDAEGIDVRRLRVVGFLKRDGSHVRQTPIPVDDHNLLRVSLIQGFSLDQQCATVSECKEHHAGGHLRTSSLLGASISLTPNAFRIGSARARQTVLVELSNARVQSLPGIFLLARSSA